MVAVAFPENATTAMRFGLNRSTAILGSLSARLLGSVRSVAISRRNAGPAARILRRGEARTTKHIRINVALRIPIILISHPPATPPLRQLAHSGMQSQHCSDQANQIAQQRPRRHGHTSIL